MSVHFRLLILFASCWMEAPWLPKVLKMLEDIYHQYPIVEDLIRNVLVGWVPKVMQLLYLTLWLLSNMFCSLSLSGSGGDNWSIYNNGLPTMFERMGQLLCLRGILNSGFSAPKLANFLLHLFRVGLLIIQFLLTILIFQPFWNLIITRIQIILSSLR